MPIQFETEEGECSYEKVSYRSVRPCILHEAVLQSNDNECNRSIYGITPWAMETCRDLVSMVDKMP